MARFVDSAEDRRWFVERKKRLSSLDHEWMKLREHIDLIDNTVELHAISLIKPSDVVNRGLDLHPGGSKALEEYLSKVWLECGGDKPRPVYSWIDNVGANMKGLEHFHEQEYLKDAIRHCRKTGKLLHPSESEYLSDVKQSLMENRRVLVYADSVVVQNTTPEALQKTRVLLMRMREEARIAALPRYYPLLDETDVRKEEDKYKKEKTSVEVASGAPGSKIDTPAMDETR